MQWNKNLLFGVLVDNTRRLLTPMRGSEKYHATRRISARIIYQKTERGGFITFSASVIVVGFNFFALFLDRTFECLVSNLLIRQKAGKVNESESRKFNDRD